MIVHHNDTPMKAQMMMIVQSQLS